MSVVSEDDSRLKFLPFKEATTPPSGHIDHLVGRWWVVHPEKGLVIWMSKGTKGGSPQCNHNEELARRIWQQMYPWAEIRFMPSVFMKLYINDYINR